MTLKEMFEKAKQEYATARAIMDEGMKDGKSLGAEKDQEAQRAFSEADRLMNLVENEKKSQELKSHIDKFGETLMTHPFNIGGANVDGEKAKAGMALMRKYLLGQELEPMERKTLSSVSDPEGGIVAFDEFRTEFITTLRNICKIRGLARVIPISGGSVTFPTFNYSGTAPSVVNQNGTVTATSVTNVFGKQQFVPVEIPLVFPIPRQLLEDAVVPIQSIMTDHFATIFSEKEENFYFTGTGNNQPLGLEKATLNMADIEGSGYAISYDDVINAVYAIKEQYRSSASCSFVLHRNVVKAVRKLKSLSSSTGDYLWQPSQMLGQPATLAGYRVTESEYMTDATTGADGDPMLIFGDFKYYWIIERLNLSIQLLNELYALQGQVGVLMRRRLDAAPVLKDAFYRVNRK